MTSSLWGLTADIRPGLDMTLVKVNTEKDVKGGKSEKEKRLPQTKQTKQYADGQGHTIVSMAVKQALANEPRAYSTCTLSSTKKRYEIHKLQSYHHQPSKTRTKSTGPRNCKKSWQRAGMPLARRHKHDKATPPSLSTKWNPLRLLFLFPLFSSVSLRAKPVFLPISGDPIYANPGRRTMDGWDRWKVDFDGRQLRMD